MYGAGCRVRDPEFGEQKVGSQIWGVGFRVLGVGFKIEGAGIREWGVGFGVQG